MKTIYRGALIEAIKCNQRNQRGEKYDCKMEYCQYWREDKQTGYSICDTYQMETDVITLLEAQKPVKPAKEYSNSKTTWWYICSSCKTAIDPNTKYCPQCGHPIEWDYINTQT